MDRRGFIKSVGGLCAALARPPASRADAVRPAWQSQLCAWLESLARDDGGYAWDGGHRGSGQTRSHLTPTFAVIGCYHALGQEPPQKARLAEFVRTHHPFEIKKLERELRVFEYQQIQSLRWLGQDASAFGRVVRGWKSPSLYPAAYERHRYPVFQNELKAFTCRALLGLPLDDLSGEFLAYLDSRRRDNGSFNNAPAADGGDGHVMNTWWGLEALAALGRGREKAKETIAWLRDCQLSSGGFTHQPRPAIGGVEDAAYTWAALRSLRQLQGAPADREGCLRFLFSLRNADGGFGGRPGWPSNPWTAYYALDALAALGALDDDLATAAPATKRQAGLPRDLNVFSIQIEAHGKGSPREAVALASALKIHLWAAKNAEPQWLARAQAIADEQKTPVTFAVANEEYGTWLDVPGMGTYSHTSDIMAPAGVDFGGSLAGQQAATWAEFRQRRLRPLEQASGRLIWQFGENEELTRMLLDESLERGGFAAISSFHFGNPDFTNSEPFLYGYRLKLPLVALQDAHGNEPWWFADMTTGFRTLFLAREPTWQGWLEALRQNWVVAVRHDAVSGQQTWMHGGTDDVQDFMLSRADRWQWWDNPNLRRPLASLVVVRPEDRWEAGRPEAGLTLRIRCAWHNTTQGRPKKPIAEFVKLLVDGQPAAAQLVAQRVKNGGLDDHYHQCHLAAPAAGLHTATAVVREIDTGREITQTVNFSV
ncbi:MAG TPA: prenyltransferase/squalene oxidase repeat-containing protein [Pirellulales bacterium]|nr:prenyltransferase/squalene oxidase repeat-containing protein [Pirellulales bacterium]